MKAFWLSMLLALGFCGLISHALAQTDPDPVKVELDTAKSDHKHSSDDANAALTAALEAQIKSLNTSGDASSAAILAAQKTAFIAAGTLPQSPLMKDAVTQFQLAMKDADAKLVDAYGKAIVEFDQESNLTQATQARRERNDLLTPGFTNGDVAANGPGGSILIPTAIAKELEAAKTQHRQAIDDAKKALLNTIDERITAATDAGKFDLVLSLQQVQATAKVDGTVPDNVNDASVAGAKLRYEATLASAQKTLIHAYQKAVRDYTRARQIALAQSTQDELNSLAPPAPVAQLLSASYGDGTRMIYVTGRIAELYKANPIIRVSNLPDPAPGSHKKLTASFKIGEQTDIFSTIEEKTFSIVASDSPTTVNSISINNHAKLVSSFFGADRRTADVRDIVAGRLKSGQPVPASADSLGISDPASGVEKSLTIQLDVDGKVFDLSVQEPGEILLGQ